MEICCQTAATQAVREITPLRPCNCSACDWQCHGGRYRLCPVERETTSLTQSCIRISRVGPCRLSAPLLQRLSLAQSRPLKRRTAKMILSSLRRSGVKRSCAFLIGSPHRNQRDQRSSSSGQLLKNSNSRRQPSLFFWLFSATFRFSDLLTVVSETVSMFPRLFSGRRLPRTDEEVL
jgi:hypothetical protein